VAQKTKRPRAAHTSKNAETVDLVERQQRIAEAAYYKAEKRGFVPGSEKEDWLEAETEIDAELPGS